ncbi:DUF362 domain-containing protein [bacterium]|nr:DUF362 domain-containing protein [candidate division CSSED10-310 bacterium]
MAQGAIVALVRCETYDRSCVESAIARGMRLLGDDIAERLAGHRSILIKPNMLQASEPDRAACTHPAVFSAVIAWLKSMNPDLDICYGDSPAAVTPGYAARRNGLAEAADEAHVPMANFTNGQDIHAPPACRNRQFHLADGVMESDGVVSISKLKTHGFVGMTGAVKNLFGCIPGLRKAEYHALFPDPYDFCRMLVEVTLTIAPLIHIMDAIVAMEGNGPNAGRPRSVHALLMSVDPVALDSVAADLIGIPHSRVHTLEWGERLGLGTSRSLTILGDTIESLCVREFEIPSPSGFHSSSPVIRLFRRWVSTRPTIIAERCVRCGQCVQICPVTPKALEIKNKKAIPQYQYSRCIRCFCCHEVCPEQAIDLRVPLPGRILRNMPLR